MRVFVLVLLMVAFLVLLPLSAPPAWAEVPVSLRGSPSSMVRQNEVAKENGLPFVASPDEVYDLAEKGELVALVGNANLEVLKGVSFPYARPEVRLFLERLAEQYRQATGEKLVVTSLLRPNSTKLWNSHQLSVHPTGIAIDLRISKRAASRAWLEGALLGLERKGVLDVTRERRPPHYHVALFPEAYRGYIEEMIGPKAVATALLWMTPSNEAKEPQTVRDPVRKEPEARPNAVVEALGRSPEDDARSWWPSIAVIPLAFALTRGLRLRARWRRRRWGT